MQTEVRWPVDEESQKGFLDSAYVRRTDDMVEFGVAKNNGIDYAWCLVPVDQFRAAMRLILPELTFDG